MAEEEASRSFKNRFLAKDAN